MPEYLDAISLSVILAILLSKYHSCPALVGLFAKLSLRQKTNSRYQIKPKTVVTLSFSYCNVWTLDKEIKMYVCFSIFSHAKRPDSGSYRQNKVGDST